MADISQINLYGTKYDVKDSTARSSVSNKQDKFVEIVRLNSGESNTITFDTNGWSTGLYCLTQNWNGNPIQFLTICSSGNRIITSIGNADNSVSGTTVTVNTGSWYSIYIIYRVISYA